MLGAEATWRDACRQGEGEFAGDLDVFCIFGGDAAQRLARPIPPLDACGYTERMANVVWVLGAGFSASLGGPMLGNLLRPELHDRLAATFPRDRFPFLFDAAAMVALHLYSFGRQYALGRPEYWQVPDRERGKWLWRDPEEFLEFVDSAGRSDNGPQASMIKAVLASGPVRGTGIAGNALEALSTAARRLLAAECALFLEESADASAERWSPYRAWMQHLVAPGHTIITFNYDRVVEVVAAASGKCQVVLPHSSLDVQKALLLKMHGSVDWQKTKGPQGLRFDIRDERVFALTCDPEEIAMAGPGQSKTTLRDELEVLWRHAEGALRDADVVVFMGYRFPESDAESRRRLLGAIRSRVVGNSKYLALHVVLGPDVRDRDPSRLEGLLRHAVGRRKEIRTQTDAITAGSNQCAGRFNLWVHPLYAQDFMAVVEGGALHQPYLFMPLP